MKLVALIPAVLAATVAMNANAFDPATNSKWQNAKDPEQAERMRQMMEIWNSMTPEEKAASNAEKYQSINYQKTAKHIEESQRRDYSSDYTY